MYVSLRYRPLSIRRGSEIALLLVGMLNVDQTADGKYNGSYSDTVCFYEPAILSYDLIIRGTEATIVGTGKTASIANNTLSFDMNLPSDLYQPNTIDALSLYLNQFVLVRYGTLVEATFSAEVSGHLGQRFSGTVGCRRTGRHLGFRFVSVGQSTNKTLIVHSTD